MYNFTINDTHSCKVLQNNWNHWRVIISKRLWGGSYFDRWSGVDNQNAQKLVLLLLIGLIFIKFSLKFDANFMVRFYLGHPVKLTATRVWYLARLQRGTWSKVLYESLERRQSGISLTKLSRRQSHCQIQSSSRWTQHRPCTKICRLDALQMDWCSSKVKPTTKSLEQFAAYTEIGITLSMTH